MLVVLGVADKGEERRVVYKKYVHNEKDHTERMI